MEKIETLLKMNMGSTFATPKKINRSSATVPGQIIEDLEAGKFTCEMIEELSKQFPIFRYQTQITIHGNFGEVSTRYIGQYKNVFQNDCGTVGIRYSAIDTGKISQIRQLLEGLKTGFHYLENSSHRLFRMSEQITKDNAPGLKEKYNAIAKRIAQAKIYGFISLYIQPTLWGGHYINLDIHPLAIPQAEIMRFVLLLTGYSPEQYNARKLEVEAQREQDKIRQAEQTAQREKDRQAARDAKEPALNKMKAFLPSSELISIKDGIICRLNTTGDADQWTYNFYRIAGKGSFGRLKVEICTCSIYPESITTLKWEDFKQYKPDELKLKGYFIQANNTPAPVKVVEREVKPIQAPAHNIPQDLKIINYSEKAIAVIGNTYPIKDTLKTMGGVFNRALKVEGNNIAGWIFAVKHRQNLEMVIYG